ncbi:MAG: hypothetical protein P8Z42_15180 [Anaerolineales bacterium]|jgi:hypothetical protein
MSRKLDNLLRLAEQSYIRMEAELLITSCVYDGDLSPINELIHELVTAGPASLFVLRDLQQIIRIVKSKLNQESLDVRQDFKQALSDFGVRLPDVIFTSNLQSWWRDQDLAREAQAAALELGQNRAVLVEEICVETGDKVSALTGRLVLVDELEHAVQDWISGLVYERAHDYEAIYLGERGTPEH